MDKSFLAKPSRRGLIRMTALAGVALTAKPSQSATAKSDPAAPENLFATFMKMRGALDDRLVVGFLEGRYYGVVESEVKPLYGLNSATFARYRNLPDGGAESFSREVAFFTDPETNKPLETWRNPYTDEVVTVQQPDMPAARIIFGADLSLHRPNSPPGATFDHRVRANTSVGDDFWLVEESFAEFKIPQQPKPFRYNEIVTLHAKVSDLAAPGAKRVPCQTSYQSVVSWRPWLKMGDRPGHLMATGSGAYGVEMAGLPPGFLAALAARYPELVKDPASSVAAIWAEKS